MEAAEIAAGVTVILRAGERGPGPDRDRERGSRLDEMQGADMAGKTGVSVLVVAERRSSESHARAAAATAMAAATKTWTAAVAVAAAMGASKRRTPPRLGEKDSPTTARVVAAATEMIARHG